MFVFNSVRGRRLRAFTVSSLAAVGTLVALPQVAAAHASFFTDEPRALAFEAVATSRNIALVIVALMCALIVRALAIERPDARRCLVRWVCEQLAVLAPLTSAVPIIARVSLGATLLLAASAGDLLQPNMELTGPAAAALLVTQLLLAVLLVTGHGSRGAALAVIGLVAVASVMFTPLVALERLDIVGLALFTALVGGRGYGTRLTQWELLSVARAAWVLRLCVATGLAITAFTEKLANPQVTASVLHQYPPVDASLLLPIDQATFIVVAAFVELLLAALVLLLPVPEITAAAICVPFVLTVGVFGPSEIAGHLPIWGALGVLTLLGAHSQTRRVIGTMTPWLPAQATVAQGTQRVVGGQYPWAAVAEVMQRIEVASPWADTVPCAPAAAPFATSFWQAPAASAPAQPAASTRVLPEPPSLSFPTQRRSA